MTSAAAVINGLLVVPNISPPSDSTTAIQISNAAATTAIVDIDTTNGRVGIGTTSPIVSLDMSQRTDALALPVGTTGQRPTGAGGEIRYNSTTSDIEVYSGGAWTSVGAASGDAFWHQVLFMPRATTGNSGADLSGNAIALTLTNAVTSTAQVKYDPYSWSFNGSSNVVYAASNAQAAFGTGDFTVELWFYATAANNYAGLVGMTATGATSWALGFTGTTTTPIWTHTATSTLITGNSNLGLNGWHHIAVVRRNGVVTLFGDGLIQGTAADTTAYVAGQLGVGFISTADSGYFQGYISGLRITGFARYLTPFTPPAAQFPSTQLGGP